MHGLSNNLFVLWISFVQTWTMAKHDAVNKSNNTLSYIISPEYSVFKTRKSLETTNIEPVPTTPPHPVWIRKYIHNNTQETTTGIIPETSPDLQDIEDLDEDIIKDCILPENNLIEDELPVEQRLMRKIMRHYERSVRPVRNASDTVVVRMGITLTQIFQMDEKNQILVTNVWLDQEWDDMFLQWNPEEYGGLEVLRLPCHKIWIPDIVLYNNAAEYTDGLMPANAMIHYTGNVFWPVPTKLQSSCKVDVTYFPFDEQHCILKFGSWTYDGFQVDMVNRTVDVDLSNYVTNGEWELISIKIYRNVVYYACCVEPFPDVTFIIHIQRRMIYYLYNVIFPCIMMSALTLLVFCLPPDSGEKITMGITVLLAFSVFLLRMGEDLPETSEYIPLLSIYLTVVMGLTSISVIMTVMVLNLHFRGPNDAPVPKWLRYLFVGRSKLGGLNLKQHDSPFVERYLKDRDFRCKQSASLRETIDNLAQELKDEMDQSGPTSRLASPNHNSTSNNNEDLNNHIPDDDDRHTQSYYFHQLSDTSAATRNYAYQGIKSNTDILNYMKKIIDRYEKEDNDENLLYQWRQVAVGVDKILFFIFLFATASATVVILIIAPVTKFI